MPETFEKILAETIRVRAPGAGTVDALRTFLSRVDADIADKRFTSLRQGVVTFNGTTGRKEVSGSNWGSVYVGDDVQPNFRVATFDLETMSSLVPSAVDPRENDGAGHPQQRAGRAHVPAQYMFREELGIKAYLDTLLDGELAALKEVAIDAAATQPGFHAIGALDYYQDRKTDTHVFHKDTVGTTLFVALHYLNPIDILGAEYIYDCQGSGQPIVSAEDRANTSARHIDVAWPKELRAAMKKARSHLPTEKLPRVHCNEIAPHGMITFVDELIYHATPLEGRRPSDWASLDYVRVLLGENKFPMRRKVTVDAENATRFKRAVSEKNLTTPNRDADGKRRFARLWICIQPRAWTQVACKAYTSAHTQPRRVISVD